MQTTRACERQLSNARMYPKQAQKPNDKKTHLGLRLAIAKGCVAEFNESKLEERCCRLSKTSEQNDSYDQHADN